MKTAGAASLIVVVAYLVAAGAWMRGAQIVRAATTHAVAQTTRADCEWADKICVTAWCDAYEPVSRVQDCIEGTAPWPHAVAYATPTPQPTRMIVSGRDGEIDKTKCYVEMEPVYRVGAACTAAQRAALPTPYPSPPPDHCWRNYVNGTFSSSCTMEQRSRFNEGPGGLPPPDALATDSPQGTCPALGAPPDVVVTHAAVLRFSCNVRVTTKMFANGDVEIVNIPRTRALHPGKGGAAYVIVRAK